MNHQYARRRLH